VDRDVGLELARQSLHFPVLRVAIHAKVSHLSQTVTSLAGNPRHLLEEAGRNRLPVSSTWEMP
jgi:hypothetical protein